MRVEVTVQYALPRRGLPHAATVRRWAWAALAGRCRGGQLTVRFVSRAEGARLNKVWRGKRGATNILAFPGGRVSPRATWLGDMAICVPVVRAEAMAQGKSVNTHCAHMVVHGALHLLGYDHRRRAEALVMERCETAILNELGYPDPYSTE